MPSSALTVTQLNRYIKSLLEGDRKLHDVLIRGEIHSFHRHFKTGHLFFSLKDGGSSLKVVMFRSAAAQLQFDPQDGMQVIEGEVPMSEMGDFATVLRSTTQGRGSFTLKFERYELLPSQLEAAVIEEAKKMNEEEA